MSGSDATNSMQSDIRDDIGAADERVWRVHIGAHKTGTTHFQAMLAEARPQIAAAGGALLLEKELRRAARGARRRPRDWREVRNRIRRWCAPHQLRVHASGCRFVAASEEDILGFVQDLLERDFYSDLAGLDMLRRAAGHDRLCLHISIRRYDSLMNSAFFEMLKFFPDTRRRWEAGLRHLLDCGTGWPGLMQRIERRVPKAHLRFWEQQRYADDPHMIVEQFLGMALQPLPTPKRPERTRSPGAGAIEEVERLDPHLPVAERMARVREIYRRHPAETAPALLSEEDAATLRARYESDLALLRNRYPELGAP
jgi:hypothetical protein